MKSNVKCPVCDHKNPELLSDDYATMYKCNNCGEVFYDEKSA